MEKVCLDTDVLIHFLRNNVEVVSKFDELGKTHFLVTTTLNSFELYNGIYRKKAVREESKADKMLGKMEVYSFNKEESKMAAGILAELILQGREISPEDSIIAAICLKNNCKLYTLNKKHFGQIPGLELV